MKAVRGGPTAEEALSVRRVGEYVSLLQCSLSIEDGGDIAANLDRIYTYLLVRLSEAHVGNDDAKFKEIGHHLTELGSAWRQAAYSRRTPRNRARHPGAAECFHLA